MTDTCPCHEPMSKNRPSTHCALDIQRYYPLMSNAVATYTVLSSTEALVEVSYSNGFTSFERVTKPVKGSLYETAYKAASIKASFQGDRLERFSRAA